MIRKRNRKISQFRYYMRILPLPIKCIVLDYFDYESTELCSGYTRSPSVLKNDILQSNAEIKEIIYKIHTKVNPISFFGSSIFAENKACFCAQELSDDWQLSEGNLSTWTNCILSHGNIFARKINRFYDQAEWLSYVATGLCLTSSGVMFLLTYLQKKKKISYKNKIVFIALLLHAVIFLFYIFFFVVTIIMICKESSTLPQRFVQRKLRKPIRKRNKLVNTFLNRNPNGQCSECAQCMPSGN